MGNSLRGGGALTEGVTAKALPLMTVVDGVDALSSTQKSTTENEEQVFLPISLSLDSVSLREAFGWKMGNNSRQGVFLFEAVTAETLL